MKSTTANQLENFVARVAESLPSKLGPCLVEAYKVGSLAHGGFSQDYSDIDIGFLLNCAEPPPAMAELIASAKSLDPDYGKKLSVFWGNPEFSWGRLPVIDRVDLLDHGVPLLYGRRADFRRPSKEEIHQEQLESIERSWHSRLSDLSQLTRLESQDRKPYIRAILYAARLIYTWDNLTVGSNDQAAQYLHKVQPAGLDLKSIDMALACRKGLCAAEDVFALQPNLTRQYESARKYISS